MSFSRSTPRTKPAIGAVITGAGAGGTTGLTPKRPSGQPTKPKPAPVPANGSGAKPVLPSAAGRVPSATAKRASTGLPTANAAPPATATASPVPAPASARGSSAGSSSKFASKLSAASAYASTVARTLQSASFQPNRRAADDPLHSDLIFHILLGIARSATAIVTRADVSWFVRLSGVSKRWNDVFHHNIKKHALWANLCVSIVNRNVAFRNQPHGITAAPTALAASASIVDAYRSASTPAGSPLALSDAISGCSGEPALFFQYRIWPLLRARYDCIEQLIARGVPLTATAENGVARARDEFELKRKTQTAAAAAVAAGKQSNAAASAVSVSSVASADGVSYSIDSDLWSGAVLSMFDHTPLKLGGTKFGGLPELPPSLDWNGAEFGEFIAQLNCNDFKDCVSTIGLLPNTGMLYFWFKFAAARGQQHTATVMYYDPATDPAAVAATTAAANAKLAANAAKRVDSRIAASTSAAPPPSVPLYSRELDASGGGGDDMPHDSDSPLNTSGPIVLDPVLYPPLPTRSVLDDPSDDDDDDDLLTHSFEQKHNKPNATTAATATATATAPSGAVSAAKPPRGVGVVEPWNSILRAVAVPEQLKSNIKLDAIHAILPASDALFLFRYGGGGGAANAPPQPAGAAAAVNALAGAIQLPAAPAAVPAVAPAASFDGVNPSSHPTVMRARAVMRESVRESGDASVVVLGPPHILTRNPLAVGVDRVLLLQYAVSNWGAAQIVFYFTIERDDLLKKRFDRVYADLAVSN